MLFWRALPPAITSGRFITVTTPTNLSHLPWQLRGQHWSHFQSSLFSPANTTCPAQPGQSGATAKNPTSILQSHTWKPGCHRDTATPQASVQFPVRIFYQHHISNFSFPASPRPCRFLSSSVDGKAAAASITPRVFLPQRALFQGMIRWWLRPHIHTPSSKCHWNHHFWGLPFKVFFHEPTESMSAPKFPRAQRLVVSSAAPGGSRAAAHQKLLSSAHPSSPLWMWTEMLNTSRSEKKSNQARECDAPCTNRLGGCSHKIRAPWLLCCKIYLYTSPLPSQFKAMKIQGTLSLLGNYWDRAPKETGMMSPPSEIIPQIFPQMKYKKVYVYWKINYIYNYTMQLYI